MVSVAEIIIGREGCGAGIFTRHIRMYIVEIFGVRENTHPIGHTLDMLSARLSSPYDL